MYNLKDRAKDIIFELREILDDKVVDQLENIDELMIDEHGVSLTQDDYLDTYNELYDLVVNGLQTKYQEVRD